MTDDPVHVAACDPGVAWTTGNVGEAFPGICTPLDWTFVGPTTEVALRRLFRRLGVLRRDEVAVPLRVEERFCATFHGRFAANVNRLRDIADRMPGMSADQTEEQLLGGLRSGAPSHPTRRRYPAIAGHMPVAVVRLVPTVRRLRVRVDQWWRTSLRTSHGLGPQALQERLVAARDQFGEVIGLHAFVSMLASGAYEQTASLADRVGAAELAPRLLGGLGLPEEAKLLDDLWDLSRDRMTLAEFLADHGYHGVGAGQLSGRPWREDSAAVAAMVEQYRHISDADHPRALRQRRTADHAAAVSDLMRRLPTWRRPSARALLRLAQAFVPAREIGKSAYLQALDVGRDAARRLGAALAEGRHIDHPEEVFFLTVGELTGAAPAGWQEVVARRRQQREAHLRVRIPAQWCGAPAPVTSHAGGEVVEVLRGVPASPGVATGPARVITDPSQVDVEPGDVIVAATTDPALAGMLTVASALVTDGGGTLAHAAIIARELGVPCVVNTITGTASISTGELLEVDGGSGTVRRLMR